jgi:hypothetical protein
MIFSARTALFLSIALGSIVLGACNYSPSSGGGTGGGATSSESAVVSFAVKDSTVQGIEFFTIDVTAIRLEKHGGVPIDAITAPVTIDFASLTDSAQLLQQVKAPVGVYDSASITLDFTNATCVLAGHSTPALLVGENGSPLTGPLTIDIDLGQTSFDAVAGSQHLVTFEFDTGQSAIVELANNRVELEPIVAVEIDGASPILLTFGTLLSVSSASHSFTATIGSQAGQPLGEITYLVDSHTIYEIDGVPSAGATGLALFELVSPGTPIQVLGVPDASVPNVAARFVVAGSGADNGTSDIAEGDVIDRLGNPTAGSNEQLVVLGHSRSAQTGFLQFGTTFTANVNFANTKVVRDQSDVIFDTDSINVGQHVKIYGTLNSNVMFANSPTAVIRAGVVHALGSTISISTATNEPTTVTMVLEQLQLLPQSAFAWQDSGLTPPNPSALTVNAGTLSSAQSLVSGTPIEITGFFAPVPDSAQDFLASSVIDVNTAPSRLLVDNEVNGFTVIVVASATRIMLQITGTAGPGELAVIDRGLAGSIPLPTTPSPTISAAGATGTYTLRDKTKAMETSFTSFASFSSALGDALAHGATLHTFSAVGVYAATTSSVPATQIGAVIE